MTTKPDDKSEDESTAKAPKPATREQGKTEELEKPQETQDLEVRTEEEIDDAESEAEVVGKTPRELYKRVRRQLKSVMEYIAQMRGLERGNRKWLEKRLEKLEEEVFEIRMEIKTLYKQAKGKGDK